MMEENVPLFNGKCIINKQRNWWYAKELTESGRKCINFGFSHCLWCALFTEAMSFFTFIESCAYKKKKEEQNLRVTKIFFFDDTNLEKHPSLNPSTFLATNV